MTHLWLLVQFEEGPANTGGPIYTWFVEKDYFNPVAAFKTKEDLVKWLEENATSVTWNGDTATTKTYNWKGELKSEDIYYAIAVEFGKPIVY